MESEWSQSNSHLCLAKGGADRVAQPLWVALSWSLQFQTTGQNLPRSKTLLVPRTPSSLERKPGTLPASRGAAPGLLPLGDASLGPQEATGTVMVQQFSQQAWSWPCEQDAVLADTSVVRTKGDEH